MYSIFGSSLSVLALTASAVRAHYANMGLDGVTCYLYNGIGGAPDGHMIVRSDNGVWVDHDDPSRHGTITVVHNQTEYDQLNTKTKIGIVCAPDNVQSTDIGIPYVEMEPTDEEFYSNKQTVYNGGESSKVFCFLNFCRGNGAK